MHIGSLMVTHAPRAVDLARCSLNFLSERYADPDRLTNLPDLHSLAPEQGIAVTSGLWRRSPGALSLFQVDLDGGRLSLRYCGTALMPRRIQHVERMSDQRLLVGNNDSLEIWRLDKPLKDIERFTSRSLSREKISHPPMVAGLHTVFRLNEHSFIGSASAADGVLQFDHQLETLHVQRMPETLYGSNYQFDESTHLNRSYVHNDLQTTHINCAYPIDGGQRVLVSTLIQGAIGIFDIVDDWRYRELTRGFVGAHGAKLDHRGSIYFCDSCTGSLVFLTREGRMLRRYQASTRWLHDAIEIAPGIFALSMPDRNRIEIHDLNRGEGECIDKHAFSLLSSVWHHRLENLSRLNLFKTVQFISFFADADSHS